ncbi:MAG: hypothetical protein WD602_00430 [Actinomycetota bacterium]
MNSAVCSLSARIPSADNQWRSFQRQREKSTATFFVGLSRAKQRTIFTYCVSRGDRDSVDALYRLLATPGSK